MTSNSTVPKTFAEVVARFAGVVAADFSQLIVAQPEDQLKTPVGELLRDAGQITGLDVQWRTEVTADDVDGRPDIGVTINGLLAGHVELKRPGMGARPEGFTGHNLKQWERFKALPNLIYTDGSEWSLYRSGELKEPRVRISDDLTKNRAKPANPERLEELHKLLSDFLYWEPIVPATAAGLAGFLAPLARILRDEVQRGLWKEGNPLQSLAKEWGGLLFPEGNDAQFADAYAQTVTYALLLAKFEGAESLRPLRAVDALQREHGLLAEALQLLEATPVRDQLKMPIELLERAIGAVDSAKVGSGGDPWLYFYEHFLGAYDPKLRNNRGVFYTPASVVGVQVRLVGELLRTRFKKPLAFADNDVVVLDPAVGTGTYPLAVVDHAIDAVQQRLGAGAVPEKVGDLADRLYAFELLVGPYSVAHLRLSQAFKNAGVVGKVPKLYLTDTLEPHDNPPAFTASLLQARLTEERERALHVKNDVRVFVCLGNPPYDREERDPSDDDGQRKGGWVRHGVAGEGASTAILQDFLEPARKVGAGVHLKNLYNDYVYFWRWALWKVFDSTDGTGIVSFITASSYLRGPGFVGMRRKMREVFDELWIIDLEGDSIGARKTDNVFAIRTPVAIAVGVRNGPPSTDTPARVWKTKLTGSEKTKLDTLDAVKSFGALQWRGCSSEWDAPFYPTGAGDFFDWPLVQDVFPWQHSGAQLKRTWPIGETQEVLVNRWRSLLASPRESRGALFRQTRDRTVAGQYPRLLGMGKEPALDSLDMDEPVPDIVPYAYRSFDRQYILRDARLGDRNRPVLHRAHGTKQTYITSLLTKILSAGPAATATDAIPDLDHFCGRGAKDVIPLWRDAEGSQPNVTKGILEQVGSTHCAVVSAEQLFSYAYGILALPAYVERFWQELELPPPRLPITKKADLFQRVAAHGAMLLCLHTYGKRFATPGDNSFVTAGSARCNKPVSLEDYPAKYSYDSKTKVLRVGDGEFAPVTPGVWDYSVSGLQVVKSWLDYRKLKPSGKKSSRLDEIRPARWEFTEDLLELLWVLEATINLEPEGAALLEEVCASELFLSSELPNPTSGERQPPRNAPYEGSQYELLEEEE